MQSLGGECSHRALPFAERLGGFENGLVGEVAQNDHRPLGGRERSQPVHQCRVDRLPRVCYETADRPSGASPDSLPPLMADSQIRYDSLHPGPRPLQLRDASPTLVRTCECLLREVSCLLTVTRDEIGRARDLRILRPAQCLERSMSVCSHVLTLSDAGAASSA